MFDLGWSELLVIALVAIIFVGPRELVPMLRAFGRFASKMKSMASEFQSQFNDALRDAELDQVKKQVESAGNLKPMNALRKQLEDIPRNVESAISGKQKATAGTAIAATSRSAATKAPAKRTAAKKTPAKKSAPSKKAISKNLAAAKPARKAATKARKTKTVTRKQAPGGTGA